MEFDKKFIGESTNARIDLDYIKNYCEWIFRFHCSLNDLDDAKIPFTERKYYLECSEDIYKDILDIFKSIWLKQFEGLEDVLPDSIKETMKDGHYDVNGVFIPECGVCKLDINDFDYPKTLRVECDIKEGNYI